MPERKRNFAIDVFKKPDESMIELPRRNEIKLKINYTIFKTKTHYWHSPLPGENYSAK